MIEPTDEMMQAFDAGYTTQDPNAIRPIPSVRAGLAAVLAIVERDRCMERRGHVFHPLAKRNQPLPLSVGRIQSYCGRVERPHAGHVWTTEPGRWCPGDEARR